MAVSSFFTSKPASFVCMHQGERRMTDWATSKVQEPPETDAAFYAKMQLRSSKSDLLACFWNTREYNVNIKRFELTPNFTLRLSWQPCLETPFAHTRMAQFTREDIARWWLHLYNKQQESLRLLVESDWLSKAQLAIWVIGSTLSFCSLSKRVCEWLSFINFVSTRDWCLIRNHARP